MFVMFCVIVVITFVIITWYFTLFNFVCQYCCPPSSVLCLLCCVVLPCVALVTSRDLYAHQVQQRRRRPWLQADHGWCCPGNLRPTGRSRDVCSCHRCRVCLNQDWTPPTEPETPLLSHLKPLYFPLWLLRLGRFWRAARDRKVSSWVACSWRQLWAAH